MLDIFWVKIIGACLTATLTFGAGFVPRIEAVRVNPLVLELLNMFGGGVFLCVALMDLLPEVVEGFEGFREAHGFNLGFILMIVGYSLLLLLEKVLFRHEHAFHHHSHSHHEAEGKVKHFPDPDDDLLPGTGKPKHNDKPEKDNKKIKDGHGHSHGEEGHGHGHGHKKEKKLKKEPTYGSIEGLSDKSNPRPTEVSSLLKKRPNADEIQITLDGEISGQLNSVAAEERAKTLEDSKHSALVTVLLLLAALAIHSFFEGVVIGTLEAGGDSFTILLAIVSHKPLESLSLGTIMIRGDLRMRTYVLVILALSLITPSGIAVGMLISSIQTEAPLLIPCFYAIAAGSFLYIATTEIVAEEISHIKEIKIGFAKYGAFCCGITFIVLINTLLPDIH